MEIGNSSFDYTNDIVKTNTMIQNNIEKSEKSLSLNENITKQEDVQIDLVETSSEEFISRQIFIENVKDEMLALENNQNSPEEQRIPASEIPQIAAFNILDEVKNDSEKLDMAIEAIYLTMKDNPNDANEIKQNVIDLLKEKAATKDKLL